MMKLQTLQVCIGNQQPPNMELVRHGLAGVCEWPRTKKLLDDKGLTQECIMEVFEEILLQSPKEYLDVHSSIDVLQDSRTYTQITLSTPSTPSGAGGYSNCPSWT